MQQRSRPSHLPAALPARAASWVARAARVAVATACVSLATSASSGEQTPNIFAPTSTPADAIRQLSVLVLGITAGIFLVVLGVLVYCIVRFRSRPGDPEHEPPQVYGSARIELAWTVVPILIVLVLFLVTVRTMATLDVQEPPPGALRVTVVAHQWWWEFRYPDLGVRTANELHVPVSDPAAPTPVFLTLESADVIHSFWVPRLAGKTDVIPNRTNHTWIQPLRTGTYVGQCAEFCGTQHAGMLLRVVVESRDDFERWVEEQRRSAVVDARVRTGRELFGSLACINCHTVRGTATGADIGPDLTHLMSRATLGAGVVPNTPDNLRAWVADPARLKPGVRMPAMGLDSRDLDAVVDYLRSLR